MSFRCTKLIKWQRLRARLTSKSRATTANSECKSLLPTSLVTCTVAFLDLLLSSAAKLAHLSLNSILLNFVCFQIPSFSSPGNVVARVNKRIQHYMPSTPSQIVPLRHWKTGGTLYASRSKRISTRKSVLHLAGSLFARENFSYAE